MSIEEEYQNRLAHLEELKKQGAALYPNQLRVTHTSAEILERFGETSKEELEKLDERFAIAGRLMFLRSFGKAGFWKIKDRRGTLQVFVEEKTLSPEIFAISKLIDLGDIVYVRGPLFRTKTNELTIRAEEIQLASKSLRPLPEKWHGLQDVETLYRQPYLDLISNYHLN